MKSIDDNGTIRYYQNSSLHRIDGPAILWANGDKEWWQNEKRHRLDGPAILCANGNKAWFQNGQRHRLDGFAIEYANGDKVWYQDDKLHRLDGPAVERHGHKEYWILDKQLSILEFKHKIYKLSKFKNTRWTKLKNNEPFCKWWFNPHNIGGKLAIQDLTAMFHSQIYYPLVP